MKSDSKLYAEIMEKLDYEPNIDPSKITLSINGGVVKVAGTVKSFPQKKIVERAIGNIQGVKGIANELEVNLLDAYKRDDSAIAKAVIQALEWDVFVPHDKIHVTVEQGHVTLSGEVIHWYQRKCAENAVRNLVGVKGVNNHIRIKWSGPKIAPSEVKEKIKKEFERNALIDSQGIQVETSDGKITLRGKVRSWPEYREASHAAWSMSGVSQVDNQLTVTTYLPP